MLMHRHAALDFDAAHQGSGTVQELYNLMNKLVEWMVHLPDKLPSEEGSSRPYSHPLA
jgi:hypothetical protein